ncbi:MAG TPA: lysophospholipid acyltransferase family protein [Candidatus Omnitrophota bacterium]|nr:lysophospholipid acyltransferase family protein [Candidatus Omnitrophota bacterium]
MAKHKPYRYPLYLLTRLGAFLLLMLPRAFALALANGIGYLGYVFVARQREKILKNLQFAYGETKSFKEIKEIGCRVMGHMLQTAVDFLRFARLSREKAAQFVEVGEAYALCKDILQEGKGLIIMTAHMGNWELLAGMFGLQGFQGAVVGRRIYYEPYNQWIVGLRASVGVQTIYSHEAVRKIRDHLRRNEIVGILPDQDIDNIKGIFVDFFGKPAYTPMAPVKFALATGTPILPAFLVRLKGNRYRLLLGQLIRPKIDGDREAAIRKYTEAWMASFEEVIRQYPDQWGWMHDRWKTTPEMIDSKKREAVSSL